MAFKCDNCGKSRTMGNRVSHAKNRSRHAFKPNIQKKRIEVDGRSMRVKLCTNCIKLINKKSKKMAEKASVKASEAAAPISA